MSVSPSLPQTGPDSQNRNSVFNLVVLVDRREANTTHARAANLTLPATEAATVRAALSKLVADAKLLIGKRLADNQDIPWIEPSEEPRESESRFMVPIHL